MLLFSLLSIPFLLLFTNCKWIAEKWRGKRAGEKQGEGHVATHCLGEPLPPMLNCLLVFLGAKGQRISALQTVPWFKLCTPA